MSAKPRIGGSGGSLRRSSVWMWSKFERLEPCKRGRAGRRSLQPIAGVAGGDVEPAG